MSRDLSRFDWLYESEGAKRGPIATSELLDLANAGTIGAATPVSYDRGTTWRPFGEIAAGLAPAPVPPPPDAVPPPPLPAATDPGAERSAACALCAKTLPESELLRYEGHFVCADCKPLFVQRLREGLALPGSRVYAGFWIRVGAKLIDGLILYAVNFVIGIAFGLVMPALVDPAATTPGEMLPFFAMTCGLMLVQLAIGVAFTVFFLTRFGGTPGKLALRLRVIRSDGSGIGTGRAFGRHFADMLSGLTIGIGYVIAGFDDEKRALHDHICDTRVVRVG
jgi:uncharacterized RDD family membrane protein YckC